MQTAARTTLLLATLLLWLAILLVLLNTAAYCVWQTAYPHPPAQTKIWQHRTYLWTIVTLAWLTAPALALFFHRHKSKRQAHLHLPTLTSRPNPPKQGVPGGGSPQASAASTPGTIQHHD